MPTLKELQQLQALPLNIKVEKTRQRIREWVDRFGADGVYVSFSGGKDSTVLLHIVREMYPNIPAVFCDTTLEFPEIRAFVKTFDNVVFLKPKMSFRQVIERYGYPFISKEVSDCVAGAKRYWEKVIKEYNALQENGDALDVAIKDYADFICMLNPTKGGEDRKYRRIRGLYEFRKKAIDNVRVQRLLNILPKEGKATIDDMPEPPDRSQFSCERYQFFLDAPFEISNRCCGVMKKEPFHRYEKVTGKVGISGQLASESKLRTQVWLRNGCNAFEAKRKMSNPMAFWTENDVLLYIYQNKIPIASVYGEVVRADEEGGQMSIGDFGLFDDETPIMKTTGCNRTGCVSCGFGCHREKKGEGRFEQLKITHPRLYDYMMRPWEQEVEVINPKTNEPKTVRLKGLNYKEIIDWINEHGNLHIRY